MSGVKPRTCQSRLNDSRDLLPPLLARSGNLREAQINSMRVALTSPYTYSPKPIISPTTTTSPTTIMSLMRLFARPAPRSFARAFSTTPPSQIAKMTIVGRLAADPEPITTSAAVPLTRYTVATSHGPKDNRQTSFFRVTSFDQGPRRDYVMGLTKG